MVKSIYQADFYATSHMGWLKTGERTGAINSLKKESTVLFFFFFFPLLPLPPPTLHLPFFFSSSPQKPVSLLFRQFFFFWLLTKPPTKHSSPRLWVFILCKLLPFLSFSLHPPLPFTGTDCNHILMITKKVFLYVVVEFLCNAGVYSHGTVGVQWRLTGLYLFSVSMDIWIDETLTSVRQHTRLKKCLLLDLQSYYKEWSKNIMTLRVSAEHRAVDVELGKDLCSFLLSVFSLSLFSALFYRKVMAQHWSFLSGFTLLQTSLLSCVCVSLYSWNMSNGMSVKYVNTVYFPCACLCVHGHVYLLDPIPSLVTRTRTFWYQGVSLRRNSLHGL